jgi:uncharacterized protein (TIGR02145 family)
MRFIYSLVLFSILLLSSCKKKEQASFVAITNFSINANSSYSFIVNYDLTITGEPNIIEKGVICSVDQEASIFSNREKDNSSNELTHKSYQISVKSPNSVFYVRPYVITNNDTVLGNILTFNSGLLYTNSSIEDIDGNVYQTTKIGEQEWMSENLKVKHFSNGDSITQLLSPSMEIQSSQDVWLYNQFDPSTDNFIGIRYNGLVLIDERNVCPTGWRIPKESDLVELRNFLGNDNHFAGKLKETGNLTDLTGNWKYPNYLATNHSGLSLRPSGMHDGGSDFNYVTEIGSFAIFSNDNQLYNFTVFSYTSNFEFYNFPNFGTGFVRCIKE